MCRDRLDTCRRAENAASREDVRQTRNGLPVCYRSPFTLLFFCSCTGYSAVLVRRVRATPPFGRFDCARLRFLLRPGWSESVPTRSSRLDEPELPGHACAPGSCVPRPKSRRYSVASACDQPICWCLRHLPAPHHAWRFSPSVPPTSGASRRCPFRLPDLPSWQPFALLGLIRRQCPDWCASAATMSWMPTHRRAMDLSIVTRHFECRRATIDGR